MRIKSILGRKQTSTVESVLKNDLCKKHLDDLCNSKDISRMVSLMVAYEIETGGEKETYQFIVGMETPQAILNLDQWHHRVQHEGV